MASKTTNPELIEVVKTLIWRANEEDALVWRALADSLRRSKRRRASVNVSKINRHSSEGETVVVPGRVLGSGALSHRVSVAALSFSRQAVEKIERAGGRCLTISDLLKENPKGSRVKIIM